MKKRYIIAIVVAIAAIVTAVLLLNPPGQGNANNPADTASPATNNTWISPGKVFVENYEPGEATEYQIQIYNGNAYSANFSVGYRYPDHVGEGYVKPTSDVVDWVWISNRKPTIASHETYTVTIRLGMPSKAIPPGDRWEFWIGIIDKSQTGMVQVELCTRWLITMK